MRSFLQDSSVLAAMIAGLLLQIASTPVAAIAAAAPTEGCMGQWLFNGVWRVKVTKVEPEMDGGSQVGWQVTEVWRNGASQQEAPADSLEQPQILETASGAKISTGDTMTSGGAYTLQAVHEFAQASQFTYTQFFRAPVGFDFSSKPKTLDVPFDAATLPLHKAQAQFTTGHPNFRFKLDCTASGVAANAEGGSNELPGKEGCMNQWMSNGVWRMRATGIAPDKNGDPNQPQIGWAVTEEWSNPTKQTISPWNMGVVDQQLVLPNGDSVSSSQSAGSQMSGGKFAFNTFAPGASLTYVQLFRPGNFNPADTPLQLVVAFDPKTVNNRPNVPHFKANPPNFRIKLSCSQ